jgi:catalase
VVREAPASFADHFSQPAMFYASLSPVEQQHLADAFTFELGKCLERSVRERMLTVLAKVETALCAEVADGLGLPLPSAEPVEHPAPSPAVSQLRPEPFPVAGRIVGVVAGPDADLAGIAALRRALDAEGVLLRVIAPHGGTLERDGAAEVVERTFATARSIEFDAVVVADGAPQDGDFRGLVLLQEAFRHLKGIGAWGDGAAVLADAGIEPDYPGVLVKRRNVDKLGSGLVTLLGRHRVWDRAPLIAASLTPPAT